jgi:predicted neutral ceramidase superfamily lipid hydrolase
MFLASSFKRCHKSDPHFDDCLVVNIEGAIRSLKNGKFLNFFILHLSFVFYLGHPRGMKKYDQNIIITFKFFFFINLIIFVNLCKCPKNIFSVFQNFFASLFLVLRLHIFKFL